MTIIVCPLRHVPEVAAARRPSHLISLLDPIYIETVPTPPDLPGHRHLRLAVDDISEPAPGMTAPEEHHVIRILDFGRDWDETRPLLVHCWAGISRSTAAAFILACERNPHAPERDIALRLRSVSSTASPNRLLVAQADDLLGRRGRMVDAAGAMGPHTFGFEGEPFDLPARF